MVRLWGSMYELNKTPQGNNLAGLLSFLIPGVGQVYNGRWIWAVVWLVITPGLWIGTGGFVGWVCHFISAYQAYSYEEISG